MSFPFYISRRYLFSKKSTNVINLISFISVVGVAVATMALVVVLSVFNGFHDMVAGFFTQFDPQIEIVPATGKYAPHDAPELDKIRQFDEIEVASECVEDQALTIFGNQQSMVMIKGVEDNFPKLTNIQNILYGDGAYELHVADLQYGIMGIRLAQSLGTGARWSGFLNIYAPRREGQLDLSNPMDGFVVDSLLSPGVVFSVQQSRYDKNYILTSIEFARNLFGCDGELTSLELKLKSGVDATAVKKKMQEVAGDKFRVLDRYEQQADTFNVMEIEKLMAYIFLTFILVVACFNIIGSLSMLIIDKKNDVETLRCLGATDKQISNIFMLEGRMITFFGAVIGVLLGLLLCFLQQQYGFVRLGSSSGAFVVDAYPVSVHYGDVAIVFITVIAVGWVAVWYPVRYMSRRLLEK
ncbi:MAG: FtsX-like permease family protein [Prevotellaceae bacterium]|nr:FtsX-like permease family protein [Prevotellaceae bacterium]